MKITITGKSLHDLEEQIIATARDIEERRLLLAEGCTCNFSIPAQTMLSHAVNGSGVLSRVRCSEAYVVCEGRANRRSFGAPLPAVVTS